MKRHLTKAMLAALLGCAGSAHAGLQSTLWSEDFSSVTLGPSVNERRAGPDSFATREALATDPETHAIPGVYSKTGPTGWAVDNNFDNFGRVDLANAGGADVLDQTVPVEDPPIVLFRTGVTGRVVGNVGVANQGSAAHGVDEWEGWSYANRDFWVRVTGDQERSGFTKAAGTIAVVDADEYDDLGDGLGGGYLNSGLTTAGIPVTGLTDVFLNFDSSWRPESYDDTHSGLGTASNNQTAYLFASFDGGTPEVVTFWDSDGGHVRTGPTDKQPDRPASAFYKGDAVNESLSFGVAVPPTANEVKFTFGYINAGNDWWWAIDNLEASVDGVSPAFWSENFDSVTLGPSINEREDNIPSIPLTTKLNSDDPVAFPPVEGASSKSGPAGWTVDNSGLKPGAEGDNNEGVYEWEGWSYSNRAFWSAAQNGGARSFKKSSGPFAIADSDEFSDLGDSALNRPMDTVLVTPKLDITGIPADKLGLVFDSSWRPEDDQTAVITVDFFDGNGPVEVLRWESDGALLHGTNSATSPTVDETVEVLLHNPSGATMAQVAFKYLNGSNNWWWAIDNVRVGAVPEPSSLALLAGVGAMGLGLRRRR